MKSIVCATRAGEGSRAVQRAAIAMAKDTSQHLVFVYIIDSRNYESLDDHMQTYLRDELFWLAKTLLRIAEKRAKAADLRPSLIIREGNVQEEISHIVKEVDANCLLLGAPRHRQDNAFDEAAIIEFAKSIQVATGINVQIVWPKTETPHDFSKRTAA